LSPDRFSIGDPRTRRSKGILTSLERPLPLVACEPPPVRAEGVERRCTSFVIAHRLSPIRNADLLPVMAHDSIVEEGNHDDLIARDGGCARL
jgi:hypothetical protein